MNRTLIIDKDRTITELIGRYLRQVGFELLAAHNGLEGIKVAFREQPDLIVLKFFLEDEPIKLTAIEFRLLLCLCEHPGQPLDRSKLLSTVWGYNDESCSRTLDTHMKRLRKKLGDHRAWIKTVHGAGYRIGELRGQPLNGSVARRVVLP
jgi:DNA-binding response OmpR family regulator